MKIESIVKRLAPSLALLFTVCLPAQSQHKYEYTFTLEDVIRLAKEQSLDAARAKNTFRSSYWQYRTYKAEFLPSLTFSSQQLPSFSKRIADVKVPGAGGQLETVTSTDFSNLISGSLSLSQNLPLTGGTFSVSSSLQRLDQFEDNITNLVRTSYTSTPISITYRQSIFGVNTFKWDKKIEPLRYEEAKRSYLRSIEEVSIKAVNTFFDLARAEQALATARFNHANNDTLYKIARGRYNIGTVGQDQVLTAELQYMSAQSSLYDAELSLNMAKNNLRTFLGFNDQVDIAIVIPQGVPSISVDLDQALALAKQNSPDMISYERQIKEAERMVAEAKANRGFRADLVASYGLNQTADDFSGVYQKPKDMQTVGLGISIPILDWGRGKGQVKMRQSTLEVVRLKVEQEQIAFEQDIVLQVRRFNTQNMQYRIAAKSDTVAQLRYEATKNRYMIGKTDILYMNDAQNSRDQAKQRYVDALRSYWQQYYSLRRSTLFDFIDKKPLSADFELIVK